MVSLYHMQGDLLASLLDMPSESLQAAAGGDHGAVGGTLNFDPLLNFPASPVNSEGYSSESSSTALLNYSRSPTASTTSAGGGSVFDQQSVGESPSQSPFMTASSGNTADFLGDPSQWMMSDVNSEGTFFHQSDLDELMPSSSEVTIDVGEYVGSMSRLDTAGDRGHCIYLTMPIL